jgi:hypothetical protein
MDDSKRQRGGTVLGNTFALNIMKKQAINQTIPIDLKIKKYGVDVRFPNDERFRKGNNILVSIMYIKPAYTTPRLLWTGEIDHR